jgi:hypothetical protein
MTDSLDEKPCALPLHIHSDLMSPSEITSLLRKQIPVASLTSETAADDKAEVKYSSAMMAECANVLPQIIQDLSSGHPLNRLGEQLGRLLQLKVADSP